MLRVLLIEAAHADAELWTRVPEAIRLEGRSMLAGLAADCITLRDCAVEIPVTRAAAAALRESISKQIGADASGRPIHRLSDAQNGCRLVSCDRAATLFCPQSPALPRPVREYDRVLLIAPESDGLLCSLASDLRGCGATPLLPDDDILRIASDKLKCFRHLRNCQIPMVLTQSIDESDGIGFPSVCKPPDGCGCEGIRQLQSREELVGVPPEYVLQPRVQGRSLSVGIIGSGDPDHPWVLPTAEQHIEWCDGRPVYRGGRIPARIDSRTDATVEQVARSVSSALRICRGYVGIDMLLVPTESGHHEVLVCEVNPRLCTSWIGYRALLGNLPASLLMQADPASGTAGKFGLPNGQTGERLSGSGNNQPGFGEDQPGRRSTDRPGAGCVTFTASGCVRKERRRDP